MVNYLGITRITWAHSDWHSGTLITVRELSVQNAENVHRVTKMG